MITPDYFPISSRKMIVCAISLPFSAIDARGENKVRLLRM